jgi:hypothetical protein
MIGFFLEHFCQGSNRDVSAFEKVKITVCKNRHTKEYFFIFNLHCSVLNHHAAHESFIAERCAGKKNCRLIPT